MSDLHVDVQIANPVCQIRPEHRETVLDEIIDGRLAGTTMWGWMCPDCHSRYGIGLGTGKGQRFKRLSAGSVIFRKVEG